MFRAIRIVAALGAAGAVSLAAAPGVSQAASVPTAASQNGSITIVHGVLGLIANVNVDGKQVLNGFNPEQVTSPMSLPPGNHRVQIFKSLAPAGSKPIMDQTLTVTPGEVATAAVGLTAAGKPTIKVYPTAESSGTLLAVRDIAAADPVSVSINNKVVHASLVSPQAAAVSVSPGSVPVGVTSSQTGTALVPTQSVPVLAGRGTALYLIGSQKDDTLTWIAQTLPTAKTAAPTQVDTGYGPPPGWTEHLWLMRAARGGLGVLVLMMLVGTAWLVRSRRTLHGSRQVAAGR